MASLLIFMSFLAWAAAGREFSFIGMLASAVTFSTPLIFGACAGIMCERSGVVNIAIEGLLLNGAFTSALVGSIASGWPGMGPKSGFWIGVLAAMITSALFAWLLAWLAIRFKVDQVIVGFFINFFVLGLTSFLSSRVLTENPDYNDTPTLGAWKIPLLERIPVLGQILFQQTVFVYGAYLLVVVFTWFLFRTKWGLRTRAVGEHPRAADTLGVNVLRLRYRNVIMAGAIAGFGGAWWTADARSVQREHHQRPWLHRPGGRDRRTLAPGGGAQRGPAVRPVRLGGRQAQPAQHRPAERVHQDDPVPHDDRRGGRVRRPVARSEGGRAALREPVGAVEQARAAGSCGSPSAGEPCDRLHLDAAARPLGERHGDVGRLRGRHDLVRRSRP